MDKPNPKRRWYHLTPDRFLLGLLVVEVFLLLSECFSWFPFNERKGWTVLIAILAVLFGCLFLILWFAVNIFCRRRFQFSLRSLLVMALVVSVACSWLAVKMQKARKQKEAVEAIQATNTETVDAIVEYDYGWTVPLGEQVDPPVPARLLELFGEDFFHDIYAVYLSGDYTDELLAHLVEMKSVQKLNLHSPQVTDDGLIHVRRLTHLKELHVRCEQVTDSGLVHLKGLINLEILTLYYTQVTDAGMVHLKGMTNLTQLGFRVTQVTDEGVEELEEAFPQLQVFR